MTDDYGLLRTILANPADDLPRLVCADWLEENGDAERAEFIRVQIALTEFRPSLYPIICGCGHPNSRPPCWDCVNRSEEDQEKYDKSVQRQREFDARSTALKRRERGLLLTHECAWVNELGWPLGGLSTAWRWKFSRGFIGEIELPTEAFLGNAGAIFAAQPIERVKLPDKRPWRAGHPAHRCGWTDSRDDFPGPTNWFVEPELFQLIAFTEANLPQNQYRKWYLDEQEAIDSLSRACVRYGRQLAGLPAMRA